jgi:hypothetical protein
MRRRIPRSTTAQEILEGLAAVAQRDPEARDRVAGQRDRPARARATGAAPLVAVRPGPRRRREPGAGAFVDEVARPKLGQGALVRRRRVRVRLANRPLVGREAEPCQVLDDRGIEGRPAPLPVVILDPKQDRCSGEPCRAPDPQRVGDVAEMQEPGRSRGESGPGGGRDQQAERGLSARRAAPSGRAVPRAPLDRGRAARGSGRPRRAA